MKKLPQKLGILVMVVIAVALWIGIGSVRARKEEQRGQAASDIATENYRAEFPLGTLISEVKAKLEKSRAPTVVRGEQYILAVLGKGRSPLYCSHKYLGPLFEFRNGSLIKLTSGDILVDCL